MKAAQKNGDDCERLDRVQTNEVRDAHVAVLATPSRDRQARTAVNAADRVRARDRHYFSRSSRGEYRQIAPELVKQGFNALAVDLRWGGTDRWNRVVNETSARNETDAIIASEDRDRRLAALLASEADMLAALRWLRANGFTGPLVVWGSSFSAMLVTMMM